MVTARQLNTAGWVAVSNAILMVPVLVLTVVLGMQEPEAGFAARLAGALLSCVASALCVYIMITLRDLLGERYNFHEVDGIISMLVYVNVAFSALELLSSVSSAATDVVGVISLFVIVFVGIVCIVFGIKLLRLGDDLYGMRQPFSYLSIATGFCFATVFLMPAGLLTSSIADVVLAIIFFRAVDAPEAPNALGPDRQER